MKLTLKVGRIHILGAMRDEVHHRHQHHQVKKSRQVPENRVPVSGPICSRLVPGLRFLNSGTNQKRQRRRYDADEKHSSPTEARKYGVERASRKKIPDRIALLK